MQRLLIIGFVLACVGPAVALDTEAPVVSIGPGARIIGPVTVRNTSGEIVLYVPTGSFIRVAINAGNFPPAKD